MTPIQNPSNKDGVRAQRGILEPPPRFARYLEFRLRGKAQDALAALMARRAQDGTVLGLGASLTSALDLDVDGLRTFQATAQRGIGVPSTPVDLWCWLRGDDPGDLLHLERTYVSILADGFEMTSTAAGFQHKEGRDLTGYVDGTENPVGDEARTTALRPDGSSMLAVQRWVHDFGAFEALGPDAQDAAIGRRIADNVEMDDAPVSAHVKRTAQESFSPEAFVLRRSMPWSEGSEGGLMFVAFATGFEAFEAQLHRMLGAEDGVADAIFQFTRPVSTAYLWVPPAEGWLGSMREVR